MMILLKANFWQVAKELENPFGQEGRAKDGEKEQAATKWWRSTSLMMMMMMIIIIIIIVINCI